MALAEFTKVGNILHTTGLQRFTMMVDNNSRQWKQERYQSIYLDWRSLIRVDLL